MLTRACGRFILHCNLYKDYGWGGTFPRFLHGGNSYKACPRAHRVCSTTLQVGSRCAYSVLIATVLVSRDKGPPFCAAALNTCLYDCVIRFDLAQRLAIVLLTCALSCECVHSSKLLLLHCNTASLVVMLSCGSKALE